MNADRWIVLVALCFMRAYSYDEQHLEHPCDPQTCGTQTLSVPLGSPVLLPCTFSLNDSVSWTHLSEKDLVQLMPKGRVNFSDPRDGRVKAFPNQGSEGNYSVCIDELRASDLGCYRCQQGEDCLQVLLVAEKSTVNVRLLIFTCGGVATFVLLIVGGYYFMKHIMCFRSQDITADPVCGGASVELSVAAAEQPGGADNVVYENDQDLASLPGVLPDLRNAPPTQSEIYPNVEQFNFERMESRRRKQRFHTELFSRLRQVSVRRHYYVNQGELRKQRVTSAQAENPSRGGLGKKRVRKDYPNPIYNRSTDQINHH